MNSEKHRWAMLLGRRGGKAAAARRTPEERQALARKAAQARWAHQRSKKEGSHENPR
jgi:hypothetical protein